jgi:glycolate oxidase
MEAAAELIARARLICGEEHVLTNPRVLSTYRSDGMRRSGPLPAAAILPGSAPEIANLVSACAASGIPYVTRGAGTSQDGGALAVSGGVLLVLSRLRRIINVAGSELTVEAGVPVAALPHLGAGTWLDTTDVLGTVGGYVADTTGVGNISAMQLVRPDGTLVELDGGFPGYDVVGAFPGSRGSAGIAVTMTLRAIPRP